MDYELTKRLALYQNASRALQEAARRSVEAQQAVEAIAPFRWGETVE